MIKLCLIISYAFVFNRKRLFELLENSLSYADIKNSNYIFLILVFKNAYFNINITFQLSCSSDLSVFF